MERYIAVDNVCAWPNLTRMSDGAIVATIFNQPTHGGWEGDVDCWASTDGGRMWTYRGTAAPHEPTTNRMNVAAGLARDGSLVVLASGWSERNRIGDYSSPDDGEVLPAWVCRSGDGGRTWSHTEAIAPPDGGKYIIPFGDVVQLADGGLGVSVYGWNPPESASLFYTSKDDGMTWSCRGAIAERNANETALVVLPDRRVLAAVRTSDDGHLEMFRSDDNGGSWTALGAATIAGQHPAHLLSLNGGRVLLTYGNRHEGAKGIGALFSDDGGETWGRPRFLVNLEGAADLGYPSSVQEDDGTIVTAYYCSGVPAHKRYHMGVVRLAG
jgi:hypothetical protein